MRVEAGCTLCGGDVLGNRETGFYCKGCNVLFSSRYVNFSSSKSIVRSQIRTFSAQFVMEQTEQKPAVEAKSPRALQSAARKLAKHAKSIEKLQAKMDSAVAALAKAEAKRKAAPARKKQKAASQKKSAARRSMQ